jgi:hypothetical protein
MESKHPSTEAAAYPPPFRDEAEELVVAVAKRRPVLVIASNREIAAAGQRGGIRVVPIHRRADKPFYNQHWDEIVRGEVAALIAMPDGRPAYDFDEGVLDLTAAQKVPRFDLPEQPWFGLDVSGLTGVLQALARLVGTAIPRGSA